MSSMLYTDLRLADGRRVDLRATAGRVDAVSPHLAPHAGETVVDAGGALALPALTDGHAHLDKTLTGLPWLAHPAGPDRASRIETERRLRPSFALPVEERAARLLERCIGSGTTAVRSHADVDTDVGVAHVEALARVRERYADAIAIEIVAFPQSGLGAGGQVVALLDAALDAGADLLGGIDPIAVDGSLDAPLDALFGLADRRGVGLDVHLHDPGATGITEIEAVAERTAALGMHGRVTISHGFSLGAASDDVLERVAARMADLGISLATHGAGAMPMPPIARLDALGVTVMAGNDGVRDTWTPFGNGDMLERAMLIAFRAGLRRDDELELALRAASEAGARVMGLAPARLEPGDRADFLTVDAETPAEALVEHPPRRLVVRAGRVVARDGRADVAPHRVPR